MGEKVGRNENEEEEVERLEMKKQDIQETKVDVEEMEKCRSQRGNDKQMKLERKGIKREEKKTR